MKACRTESGEREDWMRGAPASSNPDEHLHEADERRWDPTGGKGPERRQVEEADEGEVTGAA